MRDFIYTQQLAVRKQTAAKRIKGINREFKLLGVITRLVINGDTLQIRFSWDSRTKSVSPPMCDLSASGIDRAKSNAIRISEQLRADNYSHAWLDREIRGKKPIVIILTCKMVRDEFKNRWLKYRSGDNSSTNRQKLCTLAAYEGTLNRLMRRARLTDRTVFDSSTVDRLMNIHAENTDLKFRAKELLSVICNLFDIDYKFKNIGKRPPVARRKLPSDDEILEIYEKLGNFRSNNPFSVTYYQWVFGIIATYGLRPQEIEAIDRQKSFDPAMDRWIFLDGALCDGIKTGNRLIPPLHPHWVDNFALDRYPQHPYKPGGAKHSRTGSIADYFRRKGIGIRSYDLRHAYAIRTRQYMDLLDAANAMGHSVITHTKIYQRWIRDEDRIASVRKGMRDRGMLTH